ncbi:AMSH-like ubiquitin thioesterase 1 [Chenopodium quinoa]|uniref:AMSH-like ubiquitin thioesterase 1 n=1 Tax=Chenopodium quinoa TaxID=63459 RepID=UPI000B786100|nr:AMSH-like ubiquitin thioesterase 1 [Chenopodium quinoa]
MRPSSGRIDIAANAKKLDVDNRISLRIYFRIADNLLRQATIFRNEKNIIDLYVMLLRFSSLVSETIPRHREYASSPQSKKSLLKKQLIIALNELEALNPAVKQKIKEHERKPMYQVIGWNHNDRPNENHSLSSSVQWPLINAPSPINSQVVKATQIFSRGAYGGLNAQQNVYTIPVEEKFHKLSVSFPRPKEETLLRHSILGPNGLCRQWQPPVSDKGVRYPSNIDTTPVEIPRLQQVMAMEDGVAANKDESTVDCEKPILQPTIEPSSDSSQKPQDDEKPMISFEEPDVPETVIVKQPSPPPVLAEVQDLIPSEPPLKTEKLDTMDSSLQDSLLQSESPMELHISTSMMDTFLRLAKSNTAKNLETCGILAGSLKNRKFYITALIIPKQESTSDTCQATNEEEIFEVQDKQSLFPLGWIHTHPTQSCFMSSVDIHTHYSYQVMLPEAVAIVMAPRDRTKTHGIFRLTTPGGMSVIRHCDRRGFHSHEQPADGGPLYKQCTDVYINPKLKFDVIDLR